MTVLLDVIGASERLDLEGFYELRFCSVPLERGLLHSYADNSRSLAAFGSALLPPLEVYRCIIKTRYHNVRTAVYLHSVDSFCYFFECFQL